MLLDLNVFELASLTFRKLPKIAGKELVISIYLRGLQKFHYGHDGIKEAISEESCKGVWKVRFETDAGLFYLSPCPAYGFAVASRSAQLTKYGK